MTLISEIEASHSKTGQLIQQLKKAALLFAGSESITLVPLSQGAPAKKRVRAYAVLPDEVRDQILSLTKSGVTHVKAAAAAKVSLSTVARVVRASRKKR